MTSIVRRPLLVGITGNIGSGKSTFCRYLESFGLRIIDADKVAGNCLQLPPVIDALVKRYSENILMDSGRKETRQIDRKKLAAKVFADPEETAFLNALIHPRVLGEFAGMVASSTEAYLGFEVPLLFEAGLQECFDYLVLIYAPQELRIERLHNRGETRDSALERQARQMRDEDKLCRADLVVENTGNEETLKEKAGQLVKRMGEIPYRQLKSFF